MELAVLELCKPRIHHSSRLKPGFSSAPQSEACKAAHIQNLIKFRTINSKKEFFYERTINYFPTCFSGGGTLTSKSIAVDLDRPLMTIVHTYRPLRGWVTLWMMS